MKWVTGYGRARGKAWRDVILQKTIHNKED
jgi:hypothetical protein